ncbi:hypothetical protein ACWEKT_28565 [Nocardia takedensis]
MRRIGDTFDTITAFTGAAVAGVTLLLPITFSWAGESTPYRLAALYASVPRGAAMGVVVAVTVAVVVTTFGRPWITWLTALAGVFGLFANHFAGRNVSAPELLTTQNYLDAMFAGILLGALGVRALRSSLPAYGFALGCVAAFVFGDLADLLAIRADNPYAVLETPPGWLIAIALTLVALSTLRNSAPSRQREADDEPTELPIAPIVAALVFALVVLVASEWLSNQYDKAGGHTIDIGLAVVATVIAATVAAMLLPGRDGAGVLLVAALVPVADALGPGPRPGWSLVVVVAVTAVGLVSGLRVPLPGFALILIGALALYAIITAPYDKTAVHAIGNIALAFVAGYAGGTAKPRYTPSGVLGLGALFLPSIVTSLPEEGELPVRDAMAGVGASGRTALVITVGCALGLTALHRLRPPARPAAAPAPTGVIADI